MQPEMVIFCLQAGLEHCLLSQYLLSKAADIRPDG
jgi:hypothetical protein